MNYTLEHLTLTIEKTSVSAIFACPQAPTKGALILTHGYTSHKNALLNSLQRGAEYGIPTVLFDLPGHYLGGLFPIEKKEDLIEKTPLFFHLAQEKLQEKYSPEQIVYAGHSLGGLFALMALESAKKSLSLTGCAVGLGLKPPEEPHLFSSSLYQKTLYFRDQLISPVISSSIIFPWIQHQKEHLSLSGQRIHLLSGEDDLVIGKKGALRLQEKLQKDNHVTLDLVPSLAHHRTELIAPHLMKYLKKTFSLTP